MVGSLSHRGPDAEGFYSEPGYASGVRRLILRDAAGGAQPMQDAGASLSLNGELFSFNKDRLRLAARGAVFHTRSDTEVFLKGIALEGAAFLVRADAQFALAFYQTRAHSLLLARDPSGIAPLFYAQSDGWLLFASEAKAILSSGMLKPRLNRIAIDHFLTMLALPPGETCFEGIRILYPGQMLLADGGRIRFRENERQRADSIAYNANSVRQIDALESILLDSVARRLEADAEVGLYLSGGVDSSLIAALSAKVVPESRRDGLTAYSICLGGNKDESEHAKVTAAALGLRHVVVNVTPADIIAHFASAVRAAEVPILDHADVCLMLLADRVRADGRKAVLTGEGADEAFGGYPWQTAGRFRPFVHRLIDMFSSSLTIQKNLPFKKFNQYPLFSMLACVRGLFYSREFLGEVRDSRPPFFAALKPDRGSSQLSRSLRLDYEWILAGHLLADKGDRMSMSASIEARYPFLDRAVVEFSDRLADEWKLRAGKNKWILRKVAERHLPAEAAWRRKHLFRAEPAIHGTLRPRWADQLLSEEALRQTGLFDPALVRRAVLMRGRKWDARRPFVQAGLSGVISTQLLYHWFCEPLCDL
jgi:asparagine synthase (glutamine-hydrolysing)